MFFYNFMNSTGKGITLLFYQHNIILSVLLSVQYMQKKTSRICFIVNPSANRNRSVQHINWLTKESNKRWVSVEIIITTRQQNIPLLCRDKAKHYDIVVACGGDGTVHEVVNGIAGTGATLGVLPIGSGNDFVKSAGLNRSLSECLDIIYRQHSKNIDLIRFEGDANGWCANTIGLGLDGWANYYAHNSKIFRGGLMYVYGAIKAACTFKGSYLNLRADQNNISNHFLMVTACNGKWEGGNFYVAPGAELDDGLLNLLLIENLPKPLILSYLPRFLKGPSDKMRGVHQITCESLHYQSDLPVAVHADGEEVGTSIRNLKLSIKKKVLPVIVP